MAGHVVKAIFLAALLAALALLVATTFMTPVSNDAGAYLAVADAILAGKLPYRDLFDHKTPGIYYAFAVVLAATQRSLLAVQWIQLLAVIATAALTGWLGWRLWGRLAGGLALLLALYGGAAYQGGHLTTEAWVALASAAALLLLLHRPGQAPSSRAWLLAGGLVGVSALFKQTGVLTLAALGIWAATISGGWQQIGRRWLALAVGCATPLALTAAAFAAQGALGDLWRDAVWLNLTGYPRAGLAALLRGNLVNLRASPLLWLGVLLALFFQPPRWRRSANGHAPTLLWLALLTGVLPLSHRFYGHYVLQALPPAAVLASAGLASAWRRLDGRPAALRALVAGALLALALVDLPAWPRYLAYTQRLVDRQQIAAVAVQTLSQPGQPILAITAAAEFYFLSDRPPASRWPYLFPVNYTPERAAEMAGLIASHAVPVVIVDDSDPRPWHPTLRRAVEAHCTLHQSFGPELHVYDCR